MGWNEFAGYIAVALAALGSGYIATKFGLRPAPFYLGIAFVAFGLLLSLIFVTDTKQHVSLESEQTRQLQDSKNIGQIFAVTSWKNKNLFSCCQAGLVNNLNDGMVWGLLPIFLASFSLNLAQIGELAAIYPAVWGLLQVYTGGLSDRIGRKWMIVVGMWVQAAGIVFLVVSQGYVGWISGLILLGVGTAQVYPTLLAAVGDIAHPSWRAASVGVYRFWRDAGYAIGALSSGMIADHFGIGIAIYSVAGLTFLSGATVKVFMKETRLSDSKC